MVTVDAVLDTAKASVKHTKSCYIQGWHSVTNSKSLGADVFKMMKFNFTCVCTTRYR